jgi:hypothetical protein
MDNQELNSNAKLTSFAPEEATPINSTESSVSTEKSVNNESNNILKKEVVTRPILWGLVVFLVFFSLVIGAVSVYRMYQTEDLVEETMISDFRPPPMPCGSGGVGCALPPVEDDIFSTTPVTEDTNLEADLIEAEMQGIDQDLEEDIYSDEALGL